MEGKLKDKRVCRIFFSSPFNGMEIEREELTKKYFPVFQSLCNAKGVQFVPVDMRWGITSESSDNAQTINICLRELDRSDMFVGFFGQRYGWHGEKDEALQKNFDNAQARYPWTNSKRDRSVTEIEFLHGHLNHPGKLPAIICFRDKAYDDVLRKEAEEKQDKRKIYKYSSESEHATELMDDLKRRVWETREKCLAVDMAYRHPIDAVKVMGEGVLKHLKEVLLSESTGEQTKEEMEMQQHESFSESRRGIYIKSDRYFNELDLHVQDGNKDDADEKHPLLILGEAGSGKSALICNWLKYYHEKCQDDIILCHFIGCTPGSTSVKNILERFVSSLRKIVFTDSDHSQNLKDVSVLETRDLQSEFQGHLNALHDRQRKVVIVVDGLDQLETGGKIVTPYYWVQKEFPPTVSVIFTTKTNDLRTIEELCEKRNYKTRNIQFLNETEKTDMCVEVLKLRGKELSKDQQKRIVDSERTGNPLFLKVLLEELCAFGYFRLLDKKIDTLSQCQSAKELFDKVIERLEQDYDEEKMVEKVLSYFHVSRRGWQESEISRTLQISNDVWSKLYYALEKFLVNRAGYMGFAYKELDQAVYDRYMEGTDKKKQVLTEVVDLMMSDKQAIQDSGGLVPIHFYADLPWLCIQVDNKQLLEDLLVDNAFLEFLLRNVEKQDNSILEYWQCLGHPPDKVFDLFMKSVDVALAEKYHLVSELYLDETTVVTFTLNFLNNIGVFFELAKYDTQMLKLLHRIHGIVEKNINIQEGERDEKRMRINMDYAKTYASMLNQEKCLEYFEKVIDYFTSHTPPDSDAMKSWAACYNGAAAALSDTGRYEKAEEYYRKSISIHEQLGHEDKDENIAVTWTNIAQMHSHQGNYEQAIQEFLDVIKRQEEIYYGYEPIGLSYTLTNLGIAYRRIQPPQLDKAEDCYRRALVIKKRALGEAHLDVAIGYVNFANLEAQRQNYHKSAEYLKDAMKIMEEIKETEGHTYCIIMAENLTLFLMYQNKFEEAEKYYWIVWDFMIKHEHLDKGIPTVHGTMTNYLMQTGQFDKAKKILPDIITSKLVSPANFAQLKGIDMQLHQEERPERPYELTVARGFELFPGSDAITKTKILYDHLPNKQWQEIKEVLDIFYASEPPPGSVQDEAVLLFVYDICIQDNWTEGAKACLEYGVDRFPKSVTLWRKMSNFLSGPMSRNYPESLKALEKALELDPDKVELYLDLAVIHILSEEFEKAKPVIKLMEDKWPDIEPLQLKVKELKAAIQSVEDQNQENNKDEREKE